MCEFNTNIIPITGSIIPILIIIDLLIIAFLYILSKTNNDKKANLFVKNETKELLITIMLIISTPALIYAFCQLTSSYLGLFGINEDPTTYALSKLSEMENEIKNMLMNGYHSQIEFVKQSMDYSVIPIIVPMKVHTIKNPLTLLCLSITQESGKLYCLLSIGFLSYSPDADLNANIQILSIYSQTLSSYLNLISGQKALLKFIATTGFIALFFLSIVLRLIPPLRVAGNFMYLLAISLMLLVPFFYSVFLSMYNKELVSTICSKVDLASIDPFECNGEISLIKVGLLLPFGVLLPNLMLAFVITFVSSAKKIFEFIEV